MMQPVKSSRSLVCSNSSRYVVGKDWKEREKNIVTQYVRSFKKRGKNVGPKRRHQKKSKVIINCVCFVMKYFFFVGKL